MDDSSILEDQLAAVEPDREEKVTKSVIRKVRFTPEKAQELGQFLSDIDMSFSAFVRDAVELRQSVVKATKKRTVVIAPPPKVEPALLFELGRIGTNINQIARSLNVLKNDESQSELRAQFSFAECLVVLQQMLTELHSVIGELPKINRSAEAVEQAKIRALEKAFLRVQDELEDR